MAQLKHILFTFDYELFLGKRSGSVNRCVIEPTQKLLDVFSPYKIKAIFFVDTTWLLRLKKITHGNTPAKKDYDRVVEQLRQIAKLGHYIFPHLHPHWNDATYLPETNQWQLINYSRYRLHNLDKNEREKCFDESISLLKEILGPDYRPVAYRAGGWSIQPFEDFEPLFQKHNIAYDFSVLPGSKRISSAQQYDFSDIKINRPYRFSTDVAVPGKGSYVEFPISVLTNTGINTFSERVLLKYLSWSGGDNYGDGQSIMIETTEYTGAENGNEMVSVELLNTVKLPLYLKFLAANNYMQFISHPKMLSAHNINTFVRFIKKAFALYSIQTDFEKMLPQ